MSSNNNNIKTYKNIITSSYKLSLMEKRLIIAIIFKYEHMEQIPMDCELTLEEFSNIFTKLKVNYIQTLKETVESLYERKIHIIQDEKTNTLRWVQLIKFDENINTIQLRWSENILPYLEELKIKFEPFPLAVILNFKRKTSYRLFEIILLNKNVQEITISIDLIRKMLLLGDKYDKIYELKRFVIEPAVNELNKLLHLNLTFEQQKVGKRIAYIKFIWEKFKD